VRSGYDDVTTFAIGDGVSVLLDLRHRAGLTQREVAILLGVPDRTYQRWEARETTPTPRHQRALARLYKVAIDELGFAE
jgi:transcriptional regulator with XRE-family HTH domain